MVVEQHLAYATYTLLVSPNNKIWRATAASKRETST
jgi:hypothetical protein